MTCGITMMLKLYADSLDLGQEVTCEKNEEARYAPLLFGLHTLSLCSVILTYMVLI